jgi:hypothetical protein
MYNNKCIWRHNLLITLIISTPVYIKLDSFQKRKRISGYLAGEACRVESGGAPNSPPRRHTFWKWHGTQTFLPFFRGRVPYSIRCALPRHPILAASGPSIQSRLPPVSSEEYPTHCTNANRVHPFRNKFVYLFLCNNT